MNLLTPQIDFRAIRCIDFLSERHLQLKKREEGE